jgi:RND family efflux transporter MFP subunit
LKMKNKKKLTLHILPIIIVVVSGFIWFVGLSNITGSGGLGSQASDHLERPEARPVPTAVVKAVPKLLTREFPGKVRANRRVQLAFSVPGQLIELHALEGRIIRQGEVIARLDSRDYRNARDVTQAKYEQAKQHFDRIQSLFNRQVMPKSKYGEAKAAYDMAAAELRAREKALADTALTAPFDGVIATRLVENYEHVKGNQPIVSIQDISRVEIVLQVPEQLIARGGIKSFRNISVHFHVNPENRYNADVREWSAEADSHTRTYKLVLAMKSPEDIKVLPGMTATVIAQFPRSRPTENWNKNLTLVPSSAVVNGYNGHSYVWLIGDKASPPRCVRVDVGEPREDGIEIRSGLKPGQRVATAGVHSLDEKMSVRPVREGGEGLDG